MNKLSMETVYCKIYLLKETKKGSFVVMKSIKNIETLRKREKNEIFINQELNHKTIINFLIMEGP